MIYQYLVGYLWGALPEDPMMRQAGADKARQHWETRIERFLDRYVESHLRRRR